MALLHTWDKAQWQADLMMNALKKNYSEASLYMEHNVCISYFLHNVMTELEQSKRSDFSLDDCITETLRKYPDYPCNQTCEFLHKLVMLSMDNSFKQVRKGKVSPIFQ